jgi:hypothetical protein
VLALTIAAVVLVGTVQCAFNARQHLWSASDVSNWWPDMDQGTEREKLLRDEQEASFARWQLWARWTRATYAYGILALLAGLALALPPLHGTGAQNSLRWIASGVAFAACAGEAAWIGAVYWRGSVAARQAAKSR